jgi:Ni/Fe-hydrogenase subunit HybB-like protein
MFEPSYQAWFFTTNFFLVDRMVSKKGMPVVISKAVIFMGAMATLSTSAILAFAAIFSFQGGMWLLQKLGMGRKMETVITWVVCLSVPIAFLMLSSGASSEALGDSSLGDRQGRMESSLLIVAGSSPVQLLLGHGPGYIELQDNAKGESNQYVKMFVEQGILLMLLIIAFIVNVTHHQRYYMLATLIFLNSVVIMWTPLFWINILLCKWLEPPSDQTHSTINHLT